MTHPVPSGATNATPDFAEKRSPSRLHAFAVASASAILRIPPDEVLVLWIGVIFGLQRVQRVTGAMLIALYPQSDSHRASA